MTSSIRTLECGCYLVTTPVVPPFGGPAVDLTHRVLCSSHRQAAAEQERDKRQGTDQVPPCEACDGTGLDPHAEPSPWPSECEACGGSGKAKRCARHDYEARCCALCALDDDLQISIPGTASHLVAVAHDSAGHDDHTDGGR